MKMKAMIVAGITGGIGSGKSTVCRLLEAHGVRVFYADKEARRLMRSDPVLKQKLVDAFGIEAYRADGGLDRAFLAARIFGSERDRLRMNDLVHPVVGEAFQEFVREARKAKTPFVFKEAALLFETGVQDLDLVVVVDAPATTRMDRVEGRSGLARSEIQARMAAQMDAREMCRRADFIVDNGGHRDSLDAQVKKLLEKLADLGSAD